MSTSETSAGVAVTTAVGLVVFLAIGAGVFGIGKAVVGASSEPSITRPSLTEHTVEDRISGPTRLSSATLDGETTRLSGTVTDERGESVYGAIVAVNGSEREAKTNADGFYSLELKPGDHEITVSADRFESETWIERLSGSRWERTDVSLGPAPTELKGTVANESSAPVENAVVRLVGTGNVTSTDENGTYAFDLEPGAYTLEVIADGYETERAAVDAEERRTTTVDVPLAAPEPDESKAGDEGREGDESGGEDGGSDAEGDNAGDDTAEGDTSGSDEETAEDGIDGGADAGDGASDRSTPLTTREQVFAMLFLAGTFLASLAAVATVGLYRNWTRRP